MKQILLFSLCSCFILKSFAQPTLTAANTTPTIGSTFQNQYTNTTGVSALSGGANQTWDYSGLTDSNASVRLQAVAPASTPYAASFPTSNLAIKTFNDSAYLYFNAQTSALNQLGTVVEGITLQYTKPKIYLSYPFTYGNTFNDSVVEQAASYNLTLHGTDSLSGDGYGTLKTPGSTYSNALRVKYIENISATRDSNITYMGFPVTATIHVNIRTLSYIYYTPDTHAPLLNYATTSTHITATVLGGLFTVLDSSITSRDISYLKNYILPLSFTSFNAQLNGKEVSLQWQTAQEINTDHFTVQRGLDGRTFADINTVKANGSSGAHYTYADQDFVKTSVPPSVYYRIKETDKDGRAFYSSIATIHGNAIAVSTYPNPAKNYVNFNSKDATVADAIIIFDAKGHVVQQLSNHALNQPVNVSTLSKGSYFVQIKIKDQTINSTIVKE